MSDFKLSRVFLDRVIVYIQVSRVIEILRVNSHSKNWLLNYHENNRLLVKFSH
ncbi:MAG: hypothetical protein ACTSWN_12870 [Promethearchaeota archaeon]